VYSLVRQFVIQPTCYNIQSQKKGETIERIRLTMKHATAFEKKEAREYSEWLNVTFGMNELDWWPSNNHRSLIEELTMEWESLID